VKAVSKIRKWNTSDRYADIDLVSHDILVKDDVKVRGPPDWYGVSWLARLTEPL
jgi:hypothetical protein